jgi:2-methylaconitate cis-trans-isomerase PrpF
VDSAACQIYVRARDLGLTGTESPAVIDAQPELLKKLEAIRAYGSYMAGLSSTPTSASTERRNTPHLAIVSEAQDYSNHLKDEKISAGNIDFCIRMMFMQITHKTYAGTGSICLAVASQIPGTLVNQAMKPEAMGRGIVRFGHPAGVIEVEVAVREQDGRFSVERSAVGRTARRIMEGVVYVPESLFVGQAW